MEPNHPRTRFAAHSETLGRLVPQLGGKTADPPGDIAGQVLRLAGDLLRRGQSLRPDAAAIDVALQRLSGEDLAAFARAASAHPWTQHLARAADEAIESMLPETFDEAQTWRQWALDGLRMRDAIQSALCSLARIEALGGVAAGDLKRKLETELVERDRPLRVKARWWVALNDERRAERDLLDPAERIPCWWFSARADCDDLIALLSGEKMESPHLQSCSDCTRDLELVKPVNRPRARHLSAEDLWRYDLSLANPAERAFADAHARACVDCAQALRALSVDEELLPEGQSLGAAPTAIGSVATLPAASVQPRARRTGEVEIIDENADFRLVLQRRRQRVRVLIQIRTPGRVAAAAIFLPTAPSLALKPIQGAEGLEFDLGDEADLRGTVATLKIELPGATRYERTLTF